MRKTSLVLAWLLGCAPGGAVPHGDDTGPTAIPTTPAPTTPEDPVDRLRPSDLITPSPYPALRVEIDWVTGRRPDHQALALLEARLDSLLAGGQIVKPGGVRVVLDEELPPLGDGVHTFADLDAALKANAGPRVDGDTAVIHVLYADGRFAGDEGNSRVLGFAYGGSQAVLLADNIAEACDRHLGGPLLSGLLAAQGCRLAEATVFVHELGHLFGLVNNGLPMVEDHEDPEHGKHDDNRDCAMFWAVERSELVASIASGLLAGDDAVKPFDEACLADMEAAQAAPTP